jgi:hypothetical protein
MRTLEEILSELRHVTEWSRPNIAFETTMNLINEIEATYNQPTQPVEVVEIEIEETPVIPDDIEFTIENMIEPTPVIEEVVVEPVVTAKPVAKPVVEKVIGRKPRKK